MNILDYQRDDETVAECIDRFERITDHIDGEALAQWFDAQVANAPRTFHPTHADVMRAACADANLSALIRRMHPRDAARQAAHGYSVEHELSQVGPEPDDLLPNPADWIDIVRSGDIPPHDGRRCAECGYPLTEAHDDGHRPGWLLCPCCDTYNTGEDD
jgi:hypothetical protein